MGGRDNKGEKQLLIPNGDGEFDEKVIVFINNFKTHDE